MHRPIEADPHHLRNAASIVPIGLVHLRAEHRLRMASLDADHRKANLRQPCIEPLAERPSLDADTDISPTRLSEEFGNRLWFALDLAFADDRSRLVQHANARGPHRHV